MRPPDCRGYCRDLSAIEGYRPRRPLGRLVWTEGYPGPRKATPGASLWLVDHPPGGEDHSDGGTDPSPQYLGYFK